MRWRVGMAALLVWSGLAHGAAAGRVELSWSFSVALPPAIVYEGEAVHAALRVGNPGKTTRSCRTLFQFGGQTPQVWRLTLGAGRETTALFPFAAVVSDTPTTGRIAVFDLASGNADAPPEWQYTFVVRDGLGPVSDLRVDGHALLATDHRPVVLALRREDETGYRRWAPVKYAAAAWDRRGAPRWLMAPGGWRPASATEADGVSVITLPGGAVARGVAYDGDPLRAALSLETALTADGPAVAALGWGFAEAYTRYPRDLFARSLDLAIDRLRKRRPSMQAVLVTPPPPVGEAEATRHYAEEIRRLAREHHLDVVDLFGRFTRHPGWERFYELPEGDGATGLYPNPAGLEEIGLALAKGLW